MNKITVTSKAQTAIFRIDHRLIECRFYRVQSNKPGNHRALLQVVRDAGANTQPWADDSDRQLGAAVRAYFNRQSWCHITDANLNRLAV